ncbi:hypothetical protein [Flindersiella endophytica]
MAARLDLSRAKDIKNRNLESVRVKNIATRIASSVMLRPAYWKARGRLQQSRANFGWRRLQISERIRESLASGKATLNLAVQTAKSLVIALLIVAAGQYVPAIAASVAESRISQNTTALRDLLRHVASLGAHPPSESYSQVLTTGVGVAGTLLALYFATVGIVVTTTYLSATPQLRRLLLTLPAGRSYTTVNLYALLVGLILLSLPVIKASPTTLSLALSLAANLLLIVGLARRGAELLDFLEPTLLLRRIIKEMRRCIRNADKSRSGNPRNTRALQSRAEAIRLMDAVDAIFNLLSERTPISDASGNPSVPLDRRLYDASMFIATAWRMYANVKPLLPLESGWYPSRVKHGDTLIAPYTTVAVAIATRTPLQAPSEPDRLWLERRLAGTLARLLSRRSLPESSTLAASLPDLTRFLTGRGMFQESALWTDCLASVNVTPEETAAADYDAYRYNLADTIGLAQVNAVLGLGDYARSLQDDFLAWTLEEGRGRDRRELGPLPRALVSNLRRALDIERHAEGRVITPDYAVRQLVSRAVAIEMMDELTSLVHSLETRYVNWANAAAAPPTNVAAGPVWGRMDEAIHKLRVNLPAVEEVLELCRACKKDVDDQWPDTDLGEIRPRLAALEAVSARNIAHLAGAISTTSYAPDQPDTFGWAYFRTLDSVLDALLSGRPEILRPMVTSLFTATDTARERLAATVVREHDRVKAAYICEPIVALCQLSGIALLLSHLNEDSAFFSPFKDNWDRVLADNSVAKVNFAIASIVAFDGFIALWNGNMRTADREQAVQRYLAKRELNIDSVGDLNEEAHPSWLLDLLSRAQYYGFESIFVALHLLPCVAGQDGIIDLPRKIHELKRYRIPTEDQK